MANLQVDISPELKKGLKKYAAVNDLFLKDAVEKVISEGLKAIKAENKDIEVY